MITLGLAAIATSCQISAQQELEDRVALKAVVDEFSILADRKDVDAQMDLFTDDAVVESYRNGVLGSTFEGKEAIGSAFGGFLSQFETVYHINGQQQVTIDGERASGTSYCLVVLISTTDSVNTKLTWGVSYEDEYVKQNGTWLIEHRKSYFNWQSTETL